LLREKRLDLGKGHGVSLELPHRLRATKEALRKVTWQGKMEDAVTEKRIP